MRMYYFIIIAVLTLASCSGTRKMAGIQIGPNAAEISDSTEYELIILDPGFDTWMITHAKPLWYHSQTYLENWNIQYVSAWNARVTSTGAFYANYIDYQNHIDYGLELNYTLFYYFQFVERKLRIPILHGRPGSQGL